MRLLRASSLSSSLLLLRRPAPNRTILSSCYGARFFCSSSPPTSKLSRTVEQFQYAAPLRGIPFDVLQLQLASINNQKDTSDSTRFHIQRGNINYNLGRWEDAHKDFAQVISSSSTSTSEIDETIAKDISCLLQLKETDKASEEVSKIQTPHIQWWMKAHMSFVSGAFTDAISHYSQAIESTPEPIFELYFNRGVVYTSVRKHEEALEDFTKALDISPDNTSALRWRGEILAKLSRNELAISDLTAALESKEEDPMHTYQISYWLGMSNLNLNKAEEAIKHFNTIIDEIPSAKYQRARAFVLQDKFKEALQDLEDSSQLLEAGAIEKTDYCQCLYNTNEASKALECLNLCDEANPRLKESNYTFLMLRGDCQFVLGKYSIALQNFKKAFELVPPQIAMRVPQSQPVVDLHMRIARCLVSLKNFKATGQELDKITPTKPTVEVCMQIGNLYLLIGQAEKAVKQYSKAIELSSGKNYAEYIARGIAYMALGAKNEKDSLADFLHAQSLDAENAKDATYYIGELYFHNKKYEQAKPHFEESLRTLKDNNEFTALSHYYLSGCYWNFNEQEKAIKSLDSAIEVKKDSKFLLQRAQYHEQLQKYDEAIADFSELLDISGDDADAYEQRARCYFNKRYFEKAIADISKALALKPNQHADWYYLRSKIYAELDAYSQAIKDLDSAISLSPNDPQLYYLRSVCYHHSEQFDNSAQDCNTALRLYSTSSSSSPSFPPPQLFITFGSALFQLGDYTESAAQYKKVINENDNNNNKIDNDTLGEAHFGMGRSLLFGGNSEEAMSHFQLAIQLSPSTMTKLDILQNQLSQMNSE